jgi:quinolinate synthase
MAMNSLVGVRDCLDRGQGEITLDEDIRARAQGCIQRMLDFTAAQAAGVAPSASGFVPKIGAA